MPPETESTDPVGESASSGARGLAVRLALVGTVVVAAGLLYRSWGHELTLTRLAEREQELLDWRDGAPWQAAAVAFVAYVLVAGLSLPGAVPLTLVIGRVFGFWRGLVLVSFASTAGASLAFVLTRYLFRDSVQRRFGPQLARFNAALEREGAFYLFSLRLIPVVPFFVINAVMGLTPLRLLTFWWVSQCGMLAGTAVYVYAGASFPGLDELAEQGVSGILTPRILVAFALLAVFPFVVRGLLRRFALATGRPVEAAAEDATEDEPEDPAQARERDA